MRAGELGFQEIHAIYRPKIQRYLTRLVGAPEAEDLTQEVFVRVSRALPTFRGDAQLSTWIYRIASNAAIDQMRTASFRQDARKCSLDDLSETEGADEWIGTATPSLERQAMRRERSACFQNFVDNLPANYRAVVALSELGELTNGEIAEILGLPLDVVKIRLHRGRGKLLQELQTHCKAEDWL